MDHHNTTLALNLYYQMHRIRLVEEEIATRYSEQEMRCPTHLCIGQEAVAAGVCAALTIDDKILSGHRSHGHYLAKGGNLKAMIAELYGKATGCAKGKGGSMHLVDLEAGFMGAAPIVGSTIPVALGVAFTHQQRGIEAISVVFFGDAATETGVFHESLNFASLHQLPVLFVCENNLYSVYSPLSVRQPSGRSIYKIAQAHGVDSHYANGNEVLDVYQISSQLRSNLLAGKGPALVEFATYRWREHCGPLYDNDLGYRTEAEFEDWKQRCPIEQFKDHLLKLGVASVEKLNHIEVSIQKEISDAFQFAKSSPFPDMSELNNHIFAV